MRAAVIAAALIVLFAAAAPASATPSDAARFGIASVSAELSSNQAGDHPDLTVSLEVASDPAGGLDETGHGRPWALTRSVHASFPAGLLANLNAVDTCSTVRFVTARTGEGCPFSSQVGIGVVYASLSPNVAMHVPIYSLEPSGEDTVARFGVHVSTVPVQFDVRIRSEGDYGAEVETVGIPSASAFQAARLTFWGVPAATVHDTERLTVREAVSEYRTHSPSRSAGRAATPFLTNPTACGDRLDVRIAVDSYQEPGRFRVASAPLGEIVGCPRLRFDAGLALAPSTRETAAPSGLAAELTVAQPETGLASAHVRDVSVTLPEGISASPGAADGLLACDEQQVGIDTAPPQRARCPQGAKLGSAVVESPYLSRPLRGAVYLRSPQPGRLFRLWLVVDDLGIHAKLPGELQLDPLDGRVSAEFAELPQVPVSRVELDLKGGPRGVLTTPSSCGARRAAYTLNPWSAGAAARGAAPMVFDGPCASGFAPRLEAGTVNPVAGRFSTFSMRLTRESGEEGLARLSATLPPGLVAKLAGVAVCPDDDAARGSCGPGSRIGSVAVAVGPGTSPLWVPQPGRPGASAHLAGPYRGAPYSLAIAVPVQAGPFDLGTVTTRAALFVDPESVRVSVVSDPLPQILAGVPISYRDLRILIDRPRFTLNPTSCRPLRVGGVATSVRGSEAALSTPFQVGGCEALRLRPRLRMRLVGGTRRGAFPSLRATLTTPPGSSNLSRVQVLMPPSEFLEQAHIRTICTRVQFAADSCPRGSVYGWARAITPLLDRPLEGPVYMRSSSHRLPDLVMDLRGQLHVVIVGRTDAVRGAMRTTFENLHDAAARRFSVVLWGGRRGLLVNSRNLCARPYRARVRMEAHNGLVRDLRTPLTVSCAAARRR